LIGMRINIVCWEGAGKMIRGDGEGKIEFDGGIVGKGRRCQELFFSACVIEEGTYSEERRSCRWR